ncbi:MAG: glutamine synthetase family protein [Deinococcales bacterium]
MRDATYHLLRALGVKYVRFVTSGNSNVIRGKGVALESLRDVWEGGVGFTQALQALPVMYDAVVGESGLGPVGEAYLVADWSTLRPLAYAPSHARVFGDFHVGGQPWAHCARSFLKRMLAETDGAGYALQAGYEYEFIVLRDRDGLEPIDDTVFAATQGADVGVDLIDDIHDALALQGIEVEQHYPESSPGQHELALKPGDPLAAADGNLAVRETVRAVAREHGWVASFLPKIFENAAGNGCHLNLSLWRDGRNVVGDASRPHGLSEEGEAFMAGMLEHLPALMAITVASANSYRRIRPHFWSGAFRAWGKDNREAAVRLPTGRFGHGPNHFELKTHDATANPYLAMGAVLAAGLDGLKRGLRLPEPVQGDPGLLSDEERKARGVDALPTDLEEALRRLEGDEVLTGAIGADFVRSYVAVKRNEWEATKDMTLEAQAALLLERY